MSVPGQLEPALVHHIVNTLGWKTLRPLQEAAVAPLTSGDDAVLLAPTAGGKTEAACFPLLSRMHTARWNGTSVIYICPLKALLNNLLPRLEEYTSWLGRTTAVWHGDTPSGARRRILSARPDVLLTTPESLESMLVSANVDHSSFFSDLRAVVVDEVHAFAGDDRGWHLLAVLERLQRVTDRPLQRIGLSATVGNPEDLLGWLQGSGRNKRPGRVIAPHPTSSAQGSLSRHAPVGQGRSTRVAASVPPDDIQLDYVGSLDNAATVISALHRGEKRLVFCESRRLVEELGAKLRARGMTTFLSHASLSLDERKRAETAFAEARDCVIVSTSTLELGIDVGDLDRVIQIDAPGSVASFLQRLGRTGRRFGSTRNCLFLALDEGGMLAASGLLLQWSRGWVEPVVPPPEPRHIVAQQLLALCLQEGAVGDRRWQEWWNGLGPFQAAAEPIVRHLVAEGYLDKDGGLLFIGPEAERRFGQRHFMNLTAVFTAPPQFGVLHGRMEIGRTDPGLLTEQVDGPRRLLLAGRHWQVVYIDWRRRRCFVEPVDDGGKAKWGSTAFGRGASFEVARAVRGVLLGADPPVRLTQRAQRCLKQTRENFLDRVHPAGTLIVREAGAGLRWWTWAGHRANATLASTLEGAAAVPGQRVNDYWIRLREDLTAVSWRVAIQGARDHLCLPAVDEKAVRGLKFAETLPPRLAEATLSARLADLTSADAVLSEQMRFMALGA